MRALLLVLLLSLGCERTIEVGTSDGGSDGGSHGTGTPEAPILLPLRPGLRSLTATWASPLGGVSAVGWRVTRSSGRPAHFDQRVVDTCCSMTFTGLDAGEPSSVIVSAIGAGGESPPSQPRVGVPAALELGFTRKADLPTPRLSPSAVVSGGQLFVIGGWVGEGTVLDTVEVYDPGTDQWGARAPMPTARAGAAAVEVNGKLYLLGGLVSSGGQFSASALVEEYDPATDSWRERSPIPVMLLACSERTKATAEGGLVYLWPCPCGAQLPNPVPLQVYDPASDTWSVRATPPFFLSGSTHDFRARDGSVFALTSVGLIEYVIAGDYYVNRENVPEVDHLLGSDPQLAPTTTALLALTCTPVVDPDTGKLMQCRDFYRDDTAEPGAQWVETVPGPTARERYGLATTGDAVFIVGGDYGLTGSTWVPVGDLYVGTVQQ